MYDNYQKLEVDYERIKSFIEKRNEDVAEDKRWQVLPKDEYGRVSLHYIKDQYYFACIGPKSSRSYRFTCRFWSKTISIKNLEKELETLIYHK
jgi:hypothetical protein